MQASFNLGFFNFAKPFTLFVPQVQEHAVVGNCGSAKIDLHPFLLIRKEFVDSHDLPPLGCNSHLFPPLWVQFPLESLCGRDLNPPYRDSVLEPLNKRFFM